LGAGGKGDYGRGPEDRRGQRRYLVDVTDDGVGGVIQSTRGSQNVHFTITCFIFCTQAARHIFHRHAHPTGEVIKDAAAGWQIKSIGDMKVKATIYWVRYATHYVLYTIYYVLYTIYYMLHAID
jgi:hypothetical protein